MSEQEKMPTDGANNIQPVIARSAGETAEGDFCRSDEAIHPRILRDGLLRFQTKLARANFCRARNDGFIVLRA